MKPSIPKGTRDFGPLDIQKRHYIFSAIREVFIRFGYRQIETPTLENLSTLTGKYGEEGDKLLFKVITHVGGEETAVAKRGLRYDLTVPFARFVVMHQNELYFPFKRFQMQPVWRADRPQKGRYQEFYQCDADIVGSPSLIYEAELTQIFDLVFAKLGIPVRIEVNNRKILSGIADVFGISNYFSEMTTAVDKWDKIGPDGVVTEMTQRGISPEIAAKLVEVLQNNDLEFYRNLLRDSESGSLGIAELDTLWQYLSDYKATNQIVFSPLLARGLGYYTGCIFEVKATTTEMGSIGGGGRYANLTEIFGLPNMPGVGISFGAERIFDVMEVLQLFPAEFSESIKVLFVAFDKATHLYAFNALSKVRAQGICSDIYPDPTKLKKQIKYASDNRIPFVAIVGETEMEANQFMLKNLETGEQKSYPLDELISFLRQ
jgi:histidyl-tRNA synthetase